MKHPVGGRPDVARAVARRPRSPRRPVVVEAQLLVARADLDRRPGRAGTAASARSRALLLAGQQPGRRGGPAARRPGRAGRRRSSPGPCAPRAPRRYSALMPTGPGVYASVGAQRRRRPFDEVAVVELEARRAPRPACPSAAGRVRAASGSASTSPCENERAQVEVLARASRRAGPRRSVRRGVAEVRPSPWKSPTWYARRLRRLAVHHHAPVARRGRCRSRACERSMKSVRDGARSGTRGSPAA